MERRRRIPRVEVAGWDGKCTIEGQGGGPFDCRLLDISMLGAGVEVAFGVDSDEFIDTLVGQAMTVELVPPTGVTLSLRMTGQVVYELTGASGGIRIGLQFVGLTEPELEILQALDVMRAVW